MAPGHDSPDHLRASPPSSPRHLRGRHDRGARRCASSRRHGRAAPCPQQGFFRHQPPSPQIANRITFNPQESFFRRLEKPVPTTRVRLSERVTPIPARVLIPPERQQLLPQRVAPNGAHGFIGIATPRSAATSSARA
jgi:hypothetical protein